MGFRYNLRKDGDDGFGVRLDGGGTVIGADTFYEGGDGLDETVGLIFKKGLRKMLVVSELPIASGRGQMGNNYSPSALRLLHAGK